ncbi:type IV secretion system DNA-binding domain-containing protein [Novosphingobium sp. G106]|nr:type IV secretion system DNA-binding domain-containing protein [Novosphingobium sp. G106]
MAQSIRAVLKPTANRALPARERSPFSIRDWTRREEKVGSIFFITAQYAISTWTRPLLTLWMNIAINTMMTLKHTRTLRTCSVFDELGALHQLPAPHSGLRKPRAATAALSCSACTVSAGLREVYWLEERRAQHHQPGRVEIDPQDQRPRHRRGALEAHRIPEGAHDG